MKPLSPRFKEYVQIKCGLTALWGEGDKVGKWRIDDLLTVSISYLELLTTCDITTLQITAYKQLQKYDLCITIGLKMPSSLLQTAAAGIFCCSWSGWKTARNWRTFLVLSDLGWQNVLGDGWNVSFWDWAHSFGDLGHLIFSSKDIQLVKFSSPYIQPCLFPRASDDSVHRC